MASKTYIIDANVLIEAARNYYSFDLVPGFWVWLKDEHIAGVVRTVSMVAEEIEYPDELVTWFDEREKAGFSIDCSEPAIQREYKRMADWVIAQDFKPELMVEFLDGADLWVIAAASIRGSTVVTLEDAVGPDSKKVKIPNVCAEFGVECIKTLEYLSERNPTF